MFKGYVTVLLFRNFGYEWGGKGTSQDPCSDIYRGSSAFSEPETQVQIGIVFKNLRFVFIFPN